MGVRRTPDENIQNENNEPDNPSSSTEVGRVVRDSQLVAAGSKRGGEGEEGEEGLQEEGCCQHRDGGRCYRFAVRLVWYVGIGCTEYFL